MSETEKPSTDSKYIQQHLANERTYLAWIRTSITIIGVGFLITNLHFSAMTEHQMINNILAATIGLTSIFAGIIILVFSTLTYFNKGKGINNQTFTYSKTIIISLSFLLLLIFLVFGLYYFFTWKLV